MQELSGELIEYLATKCCVGSHFEFILQENGKPILQENEAYIIKE